MCIPRAYFILYTPHLYFAGMPRYVHSGLTMAHGSLTRMQSEGPEAAQKKSPSALTSRVGARALALLSRSLRERPPPLSLPAPSSGPLLTLFLCLDTLPGHLKLK